MEFIIKTEAGVVKLYEVNDRTLLTIEDIDLKSIKHINENVLDVINKKFIEIKDLLSKENLFVKNNNEENMFYNDFMKNDVVLVNKNGIYRVKDFDAQLTTSIDDNTKDIFIGWDANTNFSFASEITTPIGIEIEEEIEGFTELEETQDSEQDGIIGNIIFENDGSFPITPSNITENKEYILHIESKKSLAFVIFNHTMPLSEAVFRLAKALKIDSCVIHVYDKEVFTETPKFLYLDDFLKLVDK